MQLLASSRDYFAMISAVEIKRNVRIINSGYKRSRHQLRTLLYAKMAIIEVGGWTELSMDNLVERAGASLIETKNIKTLKDDIIKNTWGFDYEANFRKMLVRAIGLISVEKIESNVNAGTFTRMCASLQNLKIARNTVAHSYINPPGVTTTIPAPSLVISYFNDIHIGLKNYEHTMKTLGYI